MRSVLVVCFCILFATPASATIGLKAGMTRSGLRGDSIVEPDLVGPSTRSAAQDRDGFTFGVTLAANVYPWLRAGADVLFVPKGATYEGTWGSDPVGHFTWSGALKLDYLDLPVYMRFAPRTHAAVGPFIDLGLSLGVLLHARFAAKATSGRPGVDVSEFTSRVRAWDLGGVVGGGLEFRRGDRRYLVELRYTPGLVHIECWGDTIKNTCFSLTFGLST